MVQYKLNGKKLNTGFFNARLDPINIKMANISNLKKAVFSMLTVIT